MFSPANTRTVVINLNEHPKRWRETQRELLKLKKWFAAPRRFPAIKHAAGWRGCRASHIAVLKEALATAPPEVQHLLVCEDDFMLRSHVDCARLPELASLPADTKYDVMFLACCLRCANLSDLEIAGNHLLRVRRMVWTAGYVVHRAFWQTLLATWEANDTDAVDESWAPLQESHTFLALAPPLATQRPAEFSTVTRNAQQAGDFNVLLLFRDTSSNRAAANLVARMFPTEFVPAASVADFLQHTNRHFSRHPEVNVQIAVYDCAHVPEMAKRILETTSLFAMGKNHRLLHIDLDFHVSARRDGPENNPVIYWSPLSRFKEQRSSFV